MADMLLFACLIVGLGLGLFRDPDNKAKSPASSNGHVMGFEDFGAV